MRAKSLERHDATFLQLGAIHALRDNFRAAAETYLEALEHSPGSAELLTAAGLAYLRLGENDKALELLDASLARDPTDPRTVLAAGSLIQDKPDPDGALLSYRVAAVWAPNSAPLWSNIGMCFYRKERYVAAIACLKRAFFLDPFAWIISFNLGLVHLCTGQAPRDRADLGYISASGPSPCHPTPGSATSCSLAQGSRKHMLSQPPSDLTPAQPDSAYPRPSRSLWCTDAAHSLM